MLYYFITEREFDGHTTVIHSTFQLERKLKASPERVFAAFADEETKRRGSLGGAPRAGGHELDFKTGGKNAPR